MGIYREFFTGVSNRPDIVSIDDGVISPLKPKEIHRAIVCAKRAFGQSPCIVVSVKDRVWSDGIEVAGKVQRWNKETQAAWLKLSAQTAELKASLSPILVEAIIDTSWLSSVEAKHRLLFEVLPQGASGEDFPGRLAYRLIPEPSSVQLWHATYEEAYHACQLQRGDVKRLGYTLIDPQAKDRKANVTAYLTQPIETAVDYMLNRGVLEREFGSDRLLVRKVVYQVVPARKDVEPLSEVWRRRTMSPTGGYLRGMVGSELLSPNVLSIDNREIGIREASFLTNDESRFPLANQETPFPRIAGSRISEVNIFDLSEIKDRNPSKTFQRG